MIVAEDTRLQRRALHHEVTSSCLDVLSTEAMLEEEETGLTSEDPAG
ncbi:MAG: hypothetical protein LRY73_15695 [Bacillus sp. (in: Bacteria)]|nr:hypothetical protein [Bacillus sp. (in: firmicutes)]